MRPLSCIVVSPHLDDGVFGCGDFLAIRPGCLVLTVFAGAPRSSVSTAWDRRCGFPDAAQAMDERKNEDLRALKLLKARASWLPFLDSQYGRPVAPSRIAAAAQRIIACTQARTVLFPLGIFHSDHRLVSDALLSLPSTNPTVRWYCYADALYRFTPGLCDSRLSVLSESGLQFRLQTAQEPASKAKRSAVSCYASQLRGIAASGHVCIESIFAPERRWEIRRAVQ